MTRRAGRMGAAALLIGLLLALGPDRGASEDGSSGLALPVAESCPLCTDSLRVPIRPLDPAALESWASGAAAANEHRLAVIDSVLLAAGFGPPETEESRRQAHLLARLATLNNYRFLAHFTEDTTCVYEADAAVLTDVCRRYSDPSLVAIAQLVRLRLGLGRVCAVYDVDSKVKGEFALGGKHLPFATREAKLSGKKRRVVSFDLPTGTEDVVEVLLARHYSCAVEHSTGTGPNGPYEAFLVHDIQGGWLRKWGTHRPTAFMYWVTPGVRAEDGLPESPRVGVRIYVPNLRLKLPSILPDIHFDDLREIELPQPILPLEYLAQGRYPSSWLESDVAKGFARWTGHGPVPEPLRERFPDR